MSEFKKYSRILIPLPPDDTVKKKVRDLVHTEFRITPEYVKTPYIEGYAISWRSWFGFDKNNLNNPHLGSGTLFPLHMKRIFDDWLVEDENDDMQVVEWVDEERWKWLDVVKNADEIFHSYYNFNNSVTVRATSDIVFVTIRGYRQCAKITELEELMRHKDLYPIFRVLARRGYWNIEKIKADKIRNEFYERIGFSFEDNL